MLFSALNAVLWACAISGLLVAHVFCVRNKHWREFVALCAIDGLLLAVAMAAWQSPETFASWMQEDGWAEWATFMSFTAASVLFTLDFQRERRGDAWHWLAGTG